MTTPALAARRGLLKSHAASFVPTDIPSLQAWYKADAGTSTTTDGVGVSQWNDQSSNARHLVQATGANQPLYKTSILNGLPVLRFDGSNDSLVHLAGAEFATGSGLTLAVVAIRRGATSFGRVFVAKRSSQSNDYDNAVSTLMFENSGKDEVYRFNASKTGQTLPADGTAMLHLVWFDGTNVNQRYNGAAATVSSAASTGSFGIDQLVLGAGYVGSVSAFGQYDIAEFVICSADAGSTDRGLLETYLRTKYGL